ncbi:response regulator transcription factor [Streptomyces sp. NPDC005892]|uniref:response regulator transcription factor n=1 Tax=Streptomyces sp. NPDC005892 TaxID=3155593 RepID=UPI0033E49162
MTAAIRVLLADDQAIVRTGMAMILSAEDDIEVVAHAHDGLHAVEQAAAHRPDVILMDIRMPRLDGLDALRLLNRPGTVNPPKVVIVTTFDDDAYLNQAIEAGACGFILKDSGPRLLTEAIRAAASGDALVSPSLTLRLLRAHATGRRTGRRNGHATGRRTAATPADPLTPPSTPPLTPPLTPRELEVVLLLADGLTNAEIASALSISTGTVKTHLSNVQAKLGARNRVEIAAWAWRNGIAGAAG